MSSRMQAVRVTLLLVVSVAALAVFPSLAMGSINLTGATIDGKQSTSAPPGSVIAATATGTPSSGDQWSGTNYQFGSGTVNCADTDKVDGGHTDTVGFRVTAPRNSGSYDFGVTGRANSDCTGTSSNKKVLKNALNVTPPGANPGLPPRCGINVILVLDKSGSIQSSGNTQTVRDAASAFLTALSGTGSQVSIVDFSSSAAQPVKYTQVTAESITSTFDPYLQKEYNPSGYTNWEAAYKKVGEVNNAPGNPLADLVVFITDGDPTAHNNPSGGPTTGLTEGDVTAMRPAQVQADIVKEQGSHVFALGVGAAVTKESSASRLIAISGYDRFPGTAFEDADYTLVQNFDDLAAALRQIATQLCQASVTITKTVDKGDGKGYVVDSGWKFSASVSMSAGSYAWTQPKPPPSTGTRSQTTGDDGVATFQWHPDNSTATSTVTLSEETKPGFQFVDAKCDITAPSKSGNRVLRKVRGDTQVPKVTLKPGEFAKCAVRNQIVPGTIEIKKSANPQSSRPFVFTGSKGNFSLVDDGVDSTKASKVFAGLTPGTYTFTETVPAGWTLAGIECTPNTAATVSGATVTINLTPGGSVVCTYKDTKDIVPGTIMISKSASPQDSQAFSFTGSAPIGPFNLVDDGISPSGASQTFSGLTPGTYEVSETVPDGWELVGITCTPAAAVAIDGVTVTINLQEGSSVACTYQDKVPDSPTPPTPPTPVPPTPPTPTPPEPTPPPVGPEPVGQVAGSESGSLGIVKHAPRVVRIGDRVAFSITVTNPGRVPVENVRVRDLPPAALTLAGMRSAPTGRRLNRGAVWRLGTLAPGQSRTIRGTVRIKAGSAGTFRNYAATTGVNANTAIAHTDTRILSPRRAPQFTG